MPTMSWLKALAFPMSSARGGAPKLAELTGTTWTNFTFPSWFTASQTAAGITVDHDSAMRCATAFACTRAIAENVASLPGMVYESLGAEQKRRAAQSRAWRLLHDEPNQDMDVGTFYEMMTVWCCNRGTASAEIQRDGNDRPTALWPIHPTRVVPWRLPDGQLEYHVYTSMVYTGNPRGYRYYVVPKRNMLRLVGFGSNDGITAPGVVAFGCDEVGLAIAAQKYGSSWFGNGSRPSGIVEHPGFIKDPTKRQQFRDDLQKVHQGVENWNKVGVLWDGAKWARVEVSPNEAQFLETRNYESESICSIWNVPPALVQIFKDYKFATVDAMMRQFVMTCLRVWCIKWERAIRRQVLNVHDSQGNPVPVFPEPDLFFEFVMNALLRGDPEAQAKANTLLLQWGVLNQDEIRGRDLNLNPLPNGLGEHYVMPGNYTTLERMVTGQPPPGAAGGTKTGRSSSGSDSTADDSAAQTSAPQWDRATILALSQAAKVLQRRAGRRPTELRSRAQVAKLGDGSGCRTKRRKPATEQSAPVTTGAMTGPQTPTVASIPAPATSAVPATNDSSPLPAGEVGRNGRERAAPTAPSALETFAQHVLDEDYTRMLQIEIGKANQAAKHPDAWLTWLDDFYLRWPSAMETAIKTGVGGILMARGSQTGSDISARTLSEAHCRVSREQLLAAADGDPAGFASRVASVTAAWTARRLTL